MKRPPYPFLPFGSSGPTVKVCLSRTGTGNPSLLTLRFPGATLGPTCHCAVTYTRESFCCVSGATLLIIFVGQSLYRGERKRGPLLNFYCSLFV